MHACIPSRFHKHCTHSGSPEAVFDPIYSACTPSSFHSLPQSHSSSSPLLRLIKLCRVLRLTYDVCLLYACLARRKINKCKIEMTQESPSKCKPMRATRRCAPQWASFFPSVRVLIVSLFIHVFRTFESRIYGHADWSSPVVCLAYRY